jgi:hypothetical protein
MLLLFRLQMVSLDIRDDLFDIQRLRYALVYMDITLAQTSVGSYPCIIAVPSTNVMFCCNFLVQGGTPTSGSH